MPYDVIIFFSFLIILSTVQIDALRVRGLMVIPGLGRIDRLEIGTMVLLTTLNILLYD
jgi:hypothetical protein